MIIERIRHAGRALVWLVLGGLIATNVAAPVTATRLPAAAEPAAVQTRVTSCSALNFHPHDPGQDWETPGAALAVDGAPGWFLCDPQLPHRAVVTKVRFTVEDPVDDAQVSWCGLLRAALRPSSLPAEPQVVALAPASGTLAEPGITYLTDTTIERATVDNLLFSYWLQCYLEDDTALWGASVSYQISAANG